MSQIVIDNSELSSVNGGVRDTISLGENELEILKESGLLDDDGVINKSDLGSLERHLQNAGWNGIISGLHDDKRFENLSDMVLLKGD